jgi:hypothetical protein
MLAMDAAEEMLNRLADVVDLPMADDSSRLRVSRTLAITSLHFAASTRILCEEGLIVGAASVLRSQFESLLRGVWALHCASDHHIEVLESALTTESQQDAKRLPNAALMMVELVNLPNLENLMIALGEFKERSWAALNSFVHAGVHAVHWTRITPPLALIDQIFRMSNGLAVLAFQHLAVLAGKVELQGQVISTSLAYEACLPRKRACA